MAHWFARVEHQWAQRYYGMQRCLEATAHNKELPTKSKTIRSAVYGDIRLSASEAFLLDLPVVQRLREISQMGMLPFVYPEAKHSRFDHSLGVLFNVQKIAAQLDYQPTSYQYTNLVAAAILHDIGHGPYSHACEGWQESMGIRKVPDFGNTVYAADSAPNAYQIYGEIDTSNAKPHEQNALNIIFDHPVLIDMINRGIANSSNLRTQSTEKQSSESNTCLESSLGLQSLLKNLHLDPVLISSMIVGDIRKGSLVQIINGPLDADKFDYYQRDTYFAGAGITGTDVDYIIHTMVMKNDRDGTPRICWPTKTLNDLLHTLFSREFFYANIGFHPVSRAATALLAVAFFEAYRFISLTTRDDGGNAPYRLLAYLPFVEDGDIRSLLWEVAALRTGDPNIDSSAEIVEDLIGRLTNRDLFKRLTLSGVGRAKLNAQFHEEFERASTATNSAKGQPEPAAIAADLPSAESLVQEREKNESNEKVDPRSVVTTQGNGQLKPLTPGLLYMVSPAQSGKASRAGDRVTILDWAWRSENLRPNDDGFLEKIQKDWGYTDATRDKLETENILYILQPNKPTSEPETYVATPLWDALGSEAMKLSNGLVGYQSTMAQVQLLASHQFKVNDLMSNESEEKQVVTDIAQAYGFYAASAGEPLPPEYKNDKGQRLGPAQLDVGQPYLEFLKKLAEDLQNTRKPTAKQAKANGPGRQP